ncbi:hypothetical protein ACIQGZ_27715 [Streptomyces sp. NPDC092296]|uniref:hypothetical protein n=1 Tax=Streptomyces sp. NPDC092296 TaxID=3366012 RepID=UPI0037FCF034
MKRSLTAVLLAALLTAAVPTSALATPAATSGAAVAPSCTATGDSISPKDAFGSRPGARGVVMLHAPTTLLPPDVLRIRPYNTALPYLVVPVTWVPGEDAETWYTSEPVQLDALGRYEVYAALPFPSHPGTAVSATGVLDYTVQPVVTVARTDRATVDADHKAVTVSGTVLGRDPRDGQLQPFVGTVTVARTQQNSADTATVEVPISDDGSFRQSLTVAGGATFRITAHDGSDPAAQVVGTAACNLSVGLVDGTVALTAKTSATRVLSGATVTVSGVADWQENAAPGTRHPLAGRTVTLTYDDGGDLPAAKATAVTGADGSFSARFTVRRPGNFSVSTAAEQPYLSNAWASVPLQVQLPVAVTGFHAVLGADHRVTATGKLAATVAGSPRVTGQSVDLEYSATGKTGWKRLATASVGATGSFKVSATTTHLSGWYRVHHRAGAAFQDRASGGVRLARTNARVVSVKISPQPVAKGKKVTVKGVLQQGTTAWRAYGKQRVAVVFRAQGSTAWRTVAKAVTDRKGRFSVKVKATKDGTWAVSFAGDAGHFAARSALDFVDVR